MIVDIYYRYYRYISLYLNLHCQHYVCRQSGVGCSNISNLFQVLSMGPASNKTERTKFKISQQNIKYLTNTVTDPDARRALLQQLDDLAGVSPGLQPLQYPLVQEVPLPLGPSQGDPVDQSEMSTVDCGPITAHLNTVPSASSASCRRG